MRAHVIHVDNPFQPDRRRMREVRRRASLASLAPRGHRPVIAVLNGTPVLRANRGWHRTRLADTDHLVFVTLPQGGGGNGGSNPLRVFMSLALFAVAGPLASMLTGVAAGAAIGAGGMLLAGTTMGIQLAGTALINALMPVPRVAAQAQPSPTYTLTAQGNLARIEMPIPVQYGRVLSYPDLAAQPYWEYVGEEQFLYQLLSLGCGEFAIEDIRIEDTPISAFEEITYQVVPPGSNVTLFPTAVITSLEVSGQELLGRKDATWTRSGTTITGTKVAHGYAAGQTKYFNFTTGGGPSGVYQIASVPTADTFTITVPATGTSGACTVHDVLGGIDGFVASAAGTLATRLGVDFILPAGLYARSGGGTLSTFTVQYHVEARQVDDFGLPIGSWFTLSDAVISGKTVTPMRQSVSVDLVTPGRYRVRAWRVDALADTSDHGNQILVGGLRAYLTEPLDRGPVTLIALRMRATNNLSLQASRKIGVLATRKIPVWNGTTWSAPQASNSIAWAIADAARNGYGVTKGYGARLPDTRIDLAALLALDAVWTGRGDTFNYRFDSAQSWWEAERKIAAAGRAKCFMQGGILRTVRDGPQTVPVTLYSMRNIKKGSFSIDYLAKSDVTADAVQVTYFDATTWAQQRVTAKLPGSTAAQPSKVEKPGIDNRPQALREGTYEAAVNKYRRRIVHFGTEMEGFIPGFGDLIAVQHDLAGWGSHAEAVGWDLATRKLTVSEPLTVVASSVVGLRRADGSLSGPWAVTAGASAYEVILTATPDMTPEVAGQDRERTHVVFGSVSTYRTLAKVIAARPRGLYEVEIDAVCEDPSVHTAETGVVAPPIVTSRLPRRLTRPVVAGLFANKIPGEAARCVIGWRPAAGAEVYNVEMAEGTDVNDPNARWTRVADTSAATQAQFLLHSLRTMIRVRGVGITAGPWVAATLGSLIPRAWNTDDTPAWTVDSNPAWSS